MQAQLHNYPVVSYDHTKTTNRSAPAPSRGLALGVYNVVKALGGAKIAEIHAYLPAEGYETTKEKVETACRNMLYSGQLHQVDGRVYVANHLFYTARQEWLTRYTETGGKQNQSKPRKRKTNGNGAHGPVKFRSTLSLPSRAKVQKETDTNYALALAFSTFSGGVIIGTAIGLLVGGM